MKKLLLMPVLALISLVMSCKKDTPEVKPSSPNPKASVQSATDTCETVIADFYAGQHTLAGSISVSNDEENLYVTFTTEGGWVMGKTHLYVGSLQGMPQTPNGNPKIGLFPYQTIYNPMINNHTYTIPLNQLSGDNCIIIAAHAEVSLIDSNGQVIDSQTAWGSGTQFNQSASWASYFDYCICNGSNDGGGSTGGGMEG